MLTFFIIQKIYLNIYFSAIAGLYLYLLHFAVMKSDAFRKWQQTLRYYFELIFSAGIKSQLQQALPFWIASLITGLIAVAYANLFHYSEDLSKYIFQRYRWSLFILTPFCCDEKRCI